MSPLRLRDRVFHKFCEDEGWKPWMDQKRSVRAKRIVSYMEEFRMQTQKDEAVYVEEVLRS